MAIGFGKSREDDVVSLIAAKKYARAIEVLRAQLQKKGANPSLRMQLADVLILADKKQEAIGLLIPLADQFARDGFAAKAVSVLKKIQKVDPGRRDVEERLARQIEERQREAVSLPLSRPGGPSSDEAAGGFSGGPALEIGFEMMAPISAPALAPPALDLPERIADAPPDATLPVGEEPPPARRSHAHPCPLSLPRLRPSHRLSLAPRRSPWTERSRTTTSSISRRKARRTRRSTSRSRPSWWTSEPHRRSRCRPASSPTS